MKLYLFNIYFNSTGYWRHSREPLWSLLIHSKITLILQTRPQFHFQKMVRNTAVNGSPSTKKLFQTTVPKRLNVLQANQDLVSCSLFLLTFRSESRHIYQTWKFEKFYWHKNRFEFKEPFQKTNLVRCINAWYVSSYCWLLCTLVAKWLLKK